MHCRRFFGTQHAQNTVQFSLPKRRLRTPFLSSSLERHFMISNNSVFFISIKSSGSQQNDLTVHRIADRRPFLATSASYRSLVRRRIMAHLLIPLALAFIVGVSSAENSDTSCNKSQPGNHSGPTYPPLVNASEYLTTQPTYADAGLTTARAMTYPGSQPTAAVHTSQGSTTTSTKESYDTGKADYLYPSTTTPHTVCTSTASENTARSARPPTVATPGLTSTVTTPRASTTLRLSSVTTTKSVLEFDTPGGPCSFPTNSSACPLNCVSVNGVYRCLNVSGIGEKCDLDSGTAVCDPSLICDEQSSTCRDANLDEDCVYRQCASGLVCRGQVSKGARTFNIWTCALPSKLNEACSNDTRPCAPGLECNINVCWPAGANGNCSGGLRCPDGQECKSVSNTCGPYPSLGEDCSNGLCGPYEWSYFCDPVSGKCVDYLREGESCNPSEPVGENSCLPYLKCLPQQSGGGACRPINGVGDPCSDGEVACVRSRFRNPSRNTTCVNNRCVEDAPGSLFAECGRTGDATCPSDKRCSYSGSGVRRCLFPGSVGSGCDATSVVGCEASDGLQCLGGICRLIGFAPLGGRCFESADCAGSGSDSVVCSFGPAGYSRCIVERGVGEACDPSQFIECSSVLENLTLPFGCIRGICSRVPPDPLGKRCESSSECAPPLTCATFGGSTTCANVTSIAGEPCLPFPAFGCRPDANLQCISEISRFPTWSNCNTLVAEGERCSQDEFRICDASLDSFEQNSLLTCVLGSCVRVQRRAPRSR
jgi:hypothetical protein